MAFKQYIQYHYAPFEDAAVMTLICFQAMIREGVDFFKVHIDMQYIRPGMKFKSHETELDRSMTCYHKWAS